MDGCEIPPIRTEFLELLGEGAFGKVHKAILKDGLAYFEDERNWAYRPRMQKIIAVKELFGEFKCGTLSFLLFVAERRSAFINQQPPFTKIKVGQVLVRYLQSRVKMN